MAYRLHIDRDVNCVFVQHFDTFHEDEFEEIVADFSASPAYVKGMDTLRDVSLTTLPFGYDLEHIRSIITSRIEPLDKALGPNRKSAWVLGNVQDYTVMHQFGVIYRLNLNVAERKPFRHLEKAMKWLGIPEGYVISYSNSNHMT